MERFQQLRRMVLAGSIGLAPVLVVWVGSSVARFATDGWWLAVLIALPVGVAAIDLLTGIVHWGCDRFGDAETPVVGPLLIRAFREHHVNPGKHGRARLDRDQRGALLSERGRLGGARSVGAWRSVGVVGDRGDGGLDDGDRWGLGKPDPQMGPQAGPSAPGALLTARGACFASG